MIDLDELNAEARITDLEQSLRIATLGRRVDAALLCEYERRFAEAAKLHRRRGDMEYRWGGGPVCDWCGDEDGWASKWPCPTAVALGLNEGEN